ncbi:MAG: sigma-70 family RNA polymerase sigma factor [Colwellia sp.]|nr:sigma-70 family RNA polymerase sigma factor [Colwellia sp.]
MGNESINIKKQHIKAAGGLDLICPAFVDKLFREHHERVYLAAYRISGNTHDAEDVLQSVFLGLLKRSGNGNDPAGVNPKNYLCRSAINASLDILRSKGRRQILDFEDIDEQAGPASLSGANDLLQTELRKQLRSALSSLNQRAAEIFALRYFEAFSNADIAIMLDTSAASIAVELHRTREQLKKFLNEFSGDNL